MNHRGRPSSACSPCRARRIKVRYLENDQVAPGLTYVVQCDKAKPICSQCVRVGNACTGYRNPLDQMFRDESDSVIRRAQKSYYKPPNAGHLVEFTQSPTAAHLLPRRRLFKPVNNFLWQQSTANIDAATSPCNSSRGYRADPFHVIFYTWKPFWIPLTAISSGWHR